MLTVSEAMVTSFHLTEFASWRVHMVVVAGTGIIILALFEKTGMPK